MGIFNFPRWGFLLSVLAYGVGFSQKLTAETLTFQDWSEYPNFFITVEYLSYSDQQNLITIEVRKHNFPPRWNGATYSFGIYEGSTSIRSEVNSSSFQTSISPDTPYGVAVGTVANGEDFASTSFSFSASGSGQKWVELSESWTNDTGATQQVRLRVESESGYQSVTVTDVPPGQTITFSDLVPENSIWNLEQSYVFDGVKGWAPIQVDYDLTGTGGGVPTGTDGAQAQYLTSVINQQTGELTNKFEDVAKRLEFKLEGVSAMQNDGNTHLGDIVQGVDGILAIVDDIQGDYVYLSQIANYTGNTSAKLDDVITELQGLEVSIDGDGITVDNSEILEVLSSGSAETVAIDDTPVDVPLSPDPAITGGVATTGALLDTFASGLTSLDSSAFWSITSKAYTLTLPFPPLDTTFELDVSFAQSQLDLIRELVAWFIYILSFFLFANIISRAFP